MRKRLIKDKTAFKKEIVRRAFQYEKDILSGAIPACKDLINGVKRSRKLRKKYSYSDRAFMEVAGLYYYFYIPIQDQPTQFLVDPWQAWVLLNLFAIIDPATGRRLHQEALVFVSRKSGKTMFGATLELIFLTRYGGMSAQCFGAATVQKQAQQLMDYSKVIVRNSPALKSRIDEYRDELHYNGKDSKHKLYQLSEKQADRADGSNPSFVLYDEAHAFTNEALKEVLITGMGARSQPLFLTVTTAGFLTVGYPLYEQLELAKKVLEETIEDDGTFYALYRMDSEEEAFSCDISQLVKSNPSLGTAINKDRLEEMRKKAKLLPTSWRHFLVKNCNIFQASSENPFIALDDYKQSCSEFNISELYGGRCWIGLDLSQAVDLTAFTIMVEHKDTKKLHVIPYHFFPSKQESKKVRANGVDLTEWIEDGHIIEHEERIDYNDIYNRIIEAFSLFDVQMLGYDPFSAHDLIAKIKANIDIAHILIEPVSQNITTMSPPSKYLEELIMTQRINMGVNPVLAYCNSNSRVKYSVTSNLIRVIKDPQLNPIDSIISTIVSLACYMHTEFDELNHM